MPKVTQQSLPWDTVKASKVTLGTSLEVQWLGLDASTAGGTGSIPGQGTKMPHAAQHGQTKPNKTKNDNNNNNNKFIIKKKKSHPGVEQLGASSRPIKSAVRSQEVGQA